MAEREDARRMAETLLRAAGRAVTVRVRHAAPGQTGVPPMEVTLKPCFVKASGAAAVMLVAASALAEVAGLPAELFSVSARVVVGDTVWRVVSYAAMECGETVIGWRVQMAR
jgi:hypothetical protein